MATFKYSTPEAITSVHTTSLNSLANAGLSAASSTIANETDRLPEVQIELVLASLTPTGTPAVNVWIAYSSDATNFDDGSVSEMELIAVLPLSTSASAKRVSRSGYLRPLDFKLYVENKSGVSFGASGNTLKIRRYGGSDS